MKGNNNQNKTQIDSGQVDGVVKVLNRNIFAILITILVGTICCDLIINIPIDWPFIFSGMMFSYLYYFIVKKEIKSVIPPCGGWQKFDEFDKNNFTGYCFISYKGKVKIAYRDRDKAIMFSHHSTTCYMRECVEYINPIVYPKKPVMRYKK